VFLYQPSRAPEAGEQLRLFGKLQIPQPPVNPGGFDYRRYLSQQAIDMIFTGYGPRSIRTLKKGDFPFTQRGIFFLQNRIAQKIDKLFSGQIKVLFKAFILGTRKGMDPETKSDFVKTGTSHLLAISGLNIALVSGSFYFFLIFMRVPQKLAAALALIVCILQVLIAGPEAPVERAGCMAGIFFLSTLMAREKNSWNTFFLAFFLLLYADTHAIQSVSFQLSFLSVFSLMVFMKGLRRWPSLECIMGSLACLAGTFPMVLYHFNLFSPVSIFANLGAIPFFHLALLTGLAGMTSDFFPFLGAGLAACAKFFILCGLRWIHFFALPKWGYFFLPRPSWVKIFAYYFSLGLLTLNVWRSFLSKHVKIFTAAFWILITAAFFIPNDFNLFPQDGFSRVAGFNMTLFSAGKNELAYWKAVDSGHWLMNTGRGFPNDQAEWILAPYLRFMGVKNLAGILITDSLKKHTGGLKTLRRDFNFRTLLAPAGMRDKTFTEIRYQSVIAGERIFTGPESEIEILGIHKKQMAFAVRAGKKRIVFLPDLNEDWIKLIGQKYSFWGLDVLVLPAGADSFDLGLYEKLFDLWDPAMIIISSGGESLKEFLKERDILLLDLKNCGALTLKESFNEPNGKIPFRVDSFLRGRII